MIIFLALLSSTEEEHICRRGFWGVFFTGVILLDGRILEGHMLSQDWSSINASCLLGERVVLLKEESANDMCWWRIFKNGFEDLRVSGCYRQRRVFI